MSKICDWLNIHDLNTPKVLDILAANDSGSLVHFPYFEVDCNGKPFMPLPDQSTCMRKYVIPALSTLFGEVDRVETFLNQVQFSEPNSDDESGPYTQDNGQGHSPIISMSWHGQVDDLICLAHEAAHALQILMSNHEFMPPVARETCAFLGELSLIWYSNKHNSDLFETLSDVWNGENELYLGSNLETLTNALFIPDTPYHYSLNYPLARLAALQIFKSGASDLYDALFSSGHLGMKHLPIEPMALLADDIANHLPPMPNTFTPKSASDAYRNLGAMASLDIEYWQGQSEMRIADYYTCLLSHIQDGTAFLALNADRKPIGYATWQKPSGAKVATITRQAAPFGDHLMLQQMLERHLDQSEGILAQHRRSARQEQMAW